MLELIRNGVAPSAVIMGSADAILALGVVVARELGYAGIPMLEAPVEAFEGMAEGTRVRVCTDGRVEPA
jgi:predicted aconitase with swiveling domain